MWLLSVIHHMNLILHWYFPECQIDRLYKGTGTLSYMILDQVKICCIFSCKLKHKSCPVTCWKLLAFKCLRRIYKLVLFSHIVLLVNNDQIMHFCRSIHLSCFCYFVVTLKFCTIDELLLKSYISLVLKLLNFIQLKRWATINLGALYFLW